MTSPSMIHAARRAPDALDHVIRMVRVMQERTTGPEEACTIVHLFQAGFTEAQVHAYRDPARALMQGLPTGLRYNPPGRLAAKLALGRVPEIRAAFARRKAAERLTWSPPQVAEKIKAPGQRAAVPLPSYCPFCGTAYAFTDTDADAGGSVGQVAA